MEFQDELELKRISRKEKELRKFVSQLDTIGEILYNNLEYEGVWDLLMKLEDTRVRYYIEHYDTEAELNKRGLNVKK